MGAPQATVGDVTVEFRGDGPDTPATLRPILGLRVGDPFDPGSVRQAIDHLIATGRFRNVEGNIRNLGNGRVQVLFTITRGPAPEEGESGPGEGKDAAPPASLPYAFFHSVLTVSRDVFLDPSQVRVWAESRRPGVRREDIRFRIESGNGVLDVPVSPDGTFGMPLREELLAENPAVVANQPKGTMVLCLRAGHLAGNREWLDREGGRVRYLFLLDLCGVFCLFRECPAVGPLLGNMAMESALIPRTAVDRTPRGDRDALRAYRLGPHPRPLVFTIQAEAGSLYVSTDAEGVATLPVTDPLRAENPWVLVPDWFPVPWPDR